MQDILNPEGYSFEKINEEYKIQGGVIIKAEPVVNEAHFQDIQNRILKALDRRKSINNFSDGMVYKRNSISEIG